MHAILTNFIVFDKYNKKTMNFSNKEYIAIVIGLLLVVLLSQTKYLRFLFQTILGRAVLLASVLYFSYVHKMLGVAAALILVIIVSTSGFKLLEGAENMDGTSTDTSATSTDSTTDTTSTDATSPDTSSPGETTSSAIDTDGNPKPNLSGNVKDCMEVLKANDQTDPEWTRCQREAQILSEKKKELVDASNTKEKDDAAAVTSPSDATDSNMATEGFDVLGLERNIQMGKRSNSIPVYKRPGNGDDFNILPNDVVTLVGFSHF